MTKKENEFSIFSDNKKDTKINFMNRKQKEYNLALENEKVIK